jgi:KUP system potassium uptake protein
MTAPNESAGEARPPGRLALLALGSLGVVYGDIGTSPLYAFRECFSEQHALAPSHANVIGVLSLIFWSLILVVTLKYLTFVMRADNRGEGGILALLALVVSDDSRPFTAVRTVMALGLFGAALLYGDGMITPAISVLSAVEGLRVATSAFDPFVVPIALAVLVLLFAFQRHGTGALGIAFGPITLLWFACLAGLGIASIARGPGVVEALSPLPGLRLFATHGAKGVLVLGSVFLVVTGAEALYADMGHFGRLPIRLSWFAVVLPSLTLNYFGQGALLIREPQAIANPFFLLAPSWGLYPLVGLATVATVVASQAVISGAFSLTSQALHLGYLPRMQIDYTSAQEMGQVYVPWVNWALLAATAALVLGFGTSSALAGAYGIAVSTTMLITSLLAYVCARRVWGWSVAGAATLWAGFVVIDLAFFGANLAKVARGGWVPLVAAGAIYLVMTTWRRGRGILARQIQSGGVPVERFAAEVEGAKLVRVPGTAVYMDSNPTLIPRALLHNVKHNKVIHERVIFLNVRTLPVPRVRSSERLRVVEVPPNGLAVVADYGFLETPNVPALLRQAESRGIVYDPMTTTFVLGRETLIYRGKSGLSHWRAQLFEFLSRNAQRATLHYRLPANRVIEIGAQVYL